MHQARELKSFGKYRLIASLGKGGMAKVYLALVAGPAGFSKLLVIKMLREEPDTLTTTAADRVQMFWEEARLAARLSHPNVVQTHEVGEIGGRYFIAMEYLDGQSYSALLARGRRELLSRAEHLRIVAEVARGLHYSHTLKSYQGEPIGVVHRDVSPHNVVITYDGQVKLLDFGVATTEDPDHVTRVGVIKGKLDYIAPEQLRGETIDGRADVFALGAVLWEALVDQRFAGGKKVGDANKVQARLASGERRLDSIDPSLPRDLIAIVERATALAPDDRYPDAGAFADAIEAYLAVIEERPSAKSLAASMLTMFAAERTRMHESIDVQLQLLRHRPLELGDTTGSLPHLAHPQHEEGSSRDLPEPQLSPLNVGQSGFPPPASPIPSAPVGPYRRYLPTAMLIVCMMSIGAVLGMLWPASEPTPVAKVPAPPSLPTGASTPAAAPVAPASPAPRKSPPRTAPAPVSERVLLQVQVSPRSASLTVDGARVDAPFSGYFRKESELHMVEVAADGYRTLRRLVKLDRDQTLVLTLERASERSAEANRRVSAPVRRGEGATERRDPAVGDGEPAVPASGRPSHPAGTPVPGADIEMPSAGSLADDLYQTNPYRN